MTRAVEGIGLGFRHEIGHELLTRRPADVDWLEIQPENYVERGGVFEKNLAEAMRIWPISAHGLTLSAGALEPFARTYLQKLRAFLEQIRAPWYSDHLCF